MTVQTFVKVVDTFLKAAHKRSDDERKAMFADMAEKGKLRRQKTKPTTKGKDINTNTDNSSIGQEAQEKTTMEKTHNLGDGWIMNTEKVEIHQSGNIEIAIEYQIIDPTGTLVKSIPEMDDRMPDNVDDVREEVLRGLKKTKGQKLNAYMSGTFAEGLIKRGSIYKSKNAWERESR